jgi:hypothetical protein
MNNLPQKFSKDERREIDTLLRQQLGRLTSAFDDTHQLVRVPLRRALFERLAAKIEASFLQVDGLFRISGNFNAVCALTATFAHPLVAAVPLDADLCTAHVVAGALKLWLRCNSPLISANARRNLLNCVRAARADDALSPATLDAIRDALSLLGADEYALLQRLLMLLCRVTELSAVNRMTPRNIAICFAPNLIRSLSTDAATVVFENELEVELVELLVCRFADVFREAYAPSVAPAAAPGDDVEPHAAFECRWTKRDGRVELFETCLVHESHKLMKTKRAKVLLGDVVSVTQGAVASDAADASSTKSSSSSSNSSNSTLRNMSSLLHEVRARRGLVGQFVLKVALRPGAVISTTTTTSSGQRDVKTSQDDFLMLAFGSHEELKSALALIERLRHAIPGRVVSPRNRRSKLTKVAAVPDEDRAKSSGSVASATESEEASTDESPRKQPAARPQQQQSSGDANETKRTALRRQIASIEQAIAKMGGGGGLGLSSVLQRQKIELEKELNGLGC